MYSMVSAVGVAARERAWQGLSAEGGAQNGSQRFSFCFLEQLLCFAHSFGFFRLFDRPVRVDIKEVFVVWAHFST